MAEALEQQGHEAFVDEEYSRALDFYNQAVALAPSNPSPLVSRAQAHIKLGQFKDAVADTDRAIELNPSLPKAYLRKGIALYTMGDHDIAKAVFEQGAALGDNSQFQGWLAKCEVKLGEGIAELVQKEKSIADITLDSQPSADVPVARAPEPSPSRPAPPKYRHLWYQLPTEIVVDVLAKGINPDDARIEFGEQMLSVIINAPNANEEPYLLQLRLFGKINVPECKYTFLTTKIEIRMKKGEDIRWTSLEFDKRQSAVQTNASIVAAGPSRSTRKNWDKLEAEVKREEKDEKLEGDAALNKLFREIYSNADEDTRRAMNKSFTESNGTVLSTNWSEVGSKPVEGSAPTGMEMKKWEL